ncbi:DUF6086 family protein [Streptomyces poonensis]|uniref:Uncharacterized protein n=1 Tax=Streptomyces poonensis TaxID=68255 RepID=A0A918UE32_9ACTN|nr:DUF6086 family protein [Streptomyces poonensis]GGY94068.1 hypothetical protein GCM10010365_10930 [Streptomyces poonensis]GLJ87467.1 hypothetical protein GCM10017589_00670 [Streptomyces poonensis]
MSYIFTITETDEDVWEPALAVGQLFMGGVDALGQRILRVPTGLDDVSGDWVKVDPQLYGEFVTLALQRRGRSTHWEMIQLMDGVLPLMITLADKLGVEIPAGSLAEQAYLEWARDEDRVLSGHVWGNRDGTVSSEGPLW